MERNERARVETVGSTCSIIMMSCLLPEDTEEFGSPIETGIGATWLAGLEGPFLLFCPSSTTQSLLRPCRRVDSQSPFVQVYLEPLADNAAAGRESGEMLKTGCQCVSISVTPGPVRNGPPYPRCSRALFRPENIFLDLIPPG